MQDLEESLPKFRKTGPIGDVDEHFFPADGFDGNKPGFKFKRNGPKGMGYYSDGTDPSEVQVEIGAVAADPKPQMHTVEVPFGKDTGDVFSYRNEVTGQLVQVEATGPAGTVMKVVA